MAISQRYYVDGLLGIDTNNGSTPALAVKTMYRAFDLVTDTAGNKVINVLRGRFPEGQIDIAALTGNTGKLNLAVIGGPGKVVFDGCCAFKHFGTAAWGGPNVFANIIFKDYVGNSNQSNVVEYGRWQYENFYYNCAFVAVDSRCQDKMEFLQAAGMFVGCTFREIALSLNNNYFHSCIESQCSGLGGAPISVSCNASSSATMRGAGGWDIATFPAPFKDAANGDFSFDPLHAQYSKYMTQGYFGGRVGATFNGALGCAEYTGVAPHVKELLGFAYPHYGTWKNDERYWNAGPGPDGPADACGVVLDANGDWSLDTGTTPGGKSGRVRTSVIDLLKVGGVHGSTWFASESGVSPNKAIVDIVTGGGAPRQYQVRGHATTFAEDAVPGSTTIDWTTVTAHRGEDLIASLTGIRFVQIRYVLRIDGTA